MCPHTPNYQSVEHLCTKNNNYNQRQDISTGKMSLNRRSEPLLEPKDLKKTVSVDSKPKIIIMVKIMHIVTYVGRVVVVLLK